MKSDLSPEQIVLAGSYVLETLLCLETPSSATLISNSVHKITWNKSITTETKAKIARDLKVLGKFNLHNVRGLMLPLLELDIVYFVFGDSNKAGNKQATEDEYLEWSSNPQKIRQQKLYYAVRDVETAENVVYGLQENTIESGLENTIANLKTKYEKLDTNLLLRKFNEPYNARLAQYFASLTERLAESSKQH